MHSVCPVCCALPVLRIGIHAKALTEPNPTGVGVYARQLIPRMLALPEARAHTFILYADRPPALSPLPQVRVRLLHAPILWTQGRLAVELALHAPDAFFTPQHVLPYSAPRRSVATIHGLEYERIPEGYGVLERAYLRHVTRDAARRAARLIAPSRATADDLAARYAVPHDRITVVHHGAPEPSFAASPGTALRMRLGLAAAEPYVLTLGRVEVKKNLVTLIDAFARFREDGGSCALVLAGGDGVGALQVRAAAAASSARAFIHFAGYVSNADRASLLAGASALALVSHAEGFGIPVLEAHVAGVPVVAARATSLPEVAGDAALFADPEDPADIARALARATDPARREALSKAGRANASRFSWERAARETLAAILDTAAH